MDKIITQIPNPFVLLLVSMFLNATFSSISIVFSRIWAKKSNGLNSDFQKNIVLKIEGLENSSTRVAITLAICRIFTSYTALLAVASILTVFGKNIYFSFIISPILLVTFCYALPRAIASVFASTLMIPYYIFFNFFDKLLLPLSFFINSLKLLVYKIFKFNDKLYFLSNDERTTLSEDKSKDSLDEEERDMIHSIFEFVDTDVREIMVPRIDVNAVADTMTLNEILDEINKYGHSRIPVYNESIDNIFGILYVKDLLKAISTENGLDENADFDLKNLARKPYFIPGSKKIDDLLAEFRTNRVHIAVVVDEYGGTSGIVTLEDILEEIVGEIQDEYDNESPLIEKINDNIFMVDPKIGISDLNDELDISFPEEDIAYDTLSGLIQEKLGSIPKEGDTLETDGISISVTRMDGQRIDRVCLKKLTPEEIKQS